MNTYIITGGTGALGSRYSDHVSNEYFATRKIVLHSPRTSIQEFHVDYEVPTEFYPYDLTNPGLLPFKVGPEDSIHLIHLAGVSRSSSVQKSLQASLKEEMAINCIGLLDIIKQLWPTMKKANFGRIVLVGSVVAHKPTFGTVGYCASKAAQEGVVRALLTEGAKYNILPFGISLGYTQHGMIEKITNEYADQLLKDIPLGRFCSMKELNNTIDFLIDTPYMAGQIVHLNGGLYV